jgi:cupin superfamily acireductone dioxygenase involved in methionine salvage
MSVKVPLNIYTRFVDQIYGENCENMCGKGCKMKDHLELLIDELKSTQLIIKMLQEEIKLACTGSRNQDNLTSCAGYKSHDKLNPTNERNHGWKEIRHTRATAMMHKSYNHTDTFPP